MSVNLISSLFKTTDDLDSFINAFDQEETNNLKYYIYDSCIIESQSQSPTMLNKPIVTFLNNKDLTSN